MPQAFEAITSVILLLAGFIVVLFAAYWCTRILGKRYEAGSSPGGHIRVLDRVNLAPDRQLCIVQIGEKTLLLGVTSSSITTLGELDPDKLPQLSAAAAANNAFPDILQTFLKKTNTGNAGRRADK